MNTGSTSLSTIKVERPSWNTFMNRVRFSFRRAKNGLHLKIWRAFYDWTQNGAVDIEPPNFDEENMQVIEKLIIKAEQEYITARPHIEPRRTVLIYAEDNERSCNFITARKYEKYILHLYEQAKSWGMTTFIIDHATPFGLLAYETLLALREHGEKFNLYIFQSKVLSKCRSFRLAPETAPERVMLTMNADYFYKFYDRTGIFERFMKCVGLVYTEHKMRVSKTHIPEYLIEAWGISLKEK